MLHFVFLTRAYYVIMTFAASRKGYRKNIFAQNYAMHDLVKQPCEMYHSIQKYFGKGINKSTAFILFAMLC